MEMKPAPIITTSFPDSASASCSSNRVAMATSSESRIPSHFPQAARIPAFRAAAGPRINRERYHDNAAICCRVPSGDLKCVVGRAIIYDDQLQISQRLAPHAADGFVEVFG